MIRSVSFTDFRGLDGLELPLSQTTMLTGANSVGKTSVLEGLYCLFSETRLDVAPLSRYDRGFAIRTHQQTGIPVGFSSAYNYALFWKECPAYGKSACSITAKNNMLSWSWEYTKADLSTVPEAMFKGSPIPMDSSTQFAHWSWKRRGKQHSTKTHAYTDAASDFERFQVFSPDGGLYLWPPTAETTSVCRYFDFSSIRPAPSQLTFQESKELAKALRIINPHVTDVRNTGMENGLSVILDDEKEVTLGILGNGAVAWVSVLRAIFDIIRITENQPPVPIPNLLLIDEMGAGIHYSAMLDVWKFLRTYSTANPNIQFVFTSHSDDCIRTYCEAFSDSDTASLVRLYQRAEDAKIVPTEYRKNAFASIIDGEWEVRG